MKLNTPLVLLSFTITADYRPMCIRYVRKAATTTLTMMMMMTTATTMPILINMCFARIGNMMKTFMVWWHTHTHTINYDGIPMATKCIFLSISLSSIFSLFFHSTNRQIGQVGTTTTTTLLLHYEHGNDTGTVAMKLYENKNENCS